MAPKLKSGDRVLLELRTAEVFEGTVQYFSSENIELCDIYYHTTNSELVGNMTFWRNEVSSLRPIGNSSAVQNGSDGPAPIKMHPDEFARLKNVTYNFIFIDNFTEAFNNAVKILKGRESVAVVGLGNTFVRGKPLSLLVMSDFEQVYIFDMLCLGRLRGLQDILESTFIVKVVHDGTALFDCLYHKYNVEMKNIFDTQIVDSMISKKEENLKVKRNISECLAHNFNFPLSLLSAAVDEVTDKTWHERSLTKADKTKAAQLVTYLLSLRDCLMEKILQDYTASITSNYSKYKKMTDIELVTSNNTTVNGKH